MKRPLGLVVLCYGLGIVAGDMVTLPAAGSLILGLAVAAVCLGSVRARAWLLPLLLFVCGVANVALYKQTLSPVDLRLLTVSEPMLATVRGVVERVDVRKAIVGDEEVLRASARLKLTAIAAGRTGWQPAHGWLLASTRVAEGSPVRPGQEVEITGLLKPPPEAFARGMFDYRAHLARRQIHRQLEFEADRDLRIVADCPLSWSERFQTWSMGVLGMGFEPDDPAVGMLWALCVGWLLPLTDEVSEPFMRSGTMHLFAISGQHVALIAGILVALLRLVRIPRRAVGWLVIPILWFYTAATGWQPSAVRSTIMMTVIIVGWTLERPVDLLNSLAAAAFLILLWDPQQLFQAGFQLSFAVVASIGLLLPPIELWRQRLLRTDPLLPLELRPVWQQRLDLPLRFVTVSFAVSLAAWLGSLPLIMAYFHLFTPVGLIANIIVVQFGSLALASALGSLLCSSVAPFMTELFNHAAWFFAHAMASSSAWFSELPGAWCYVKAPPLVAMAAYYVALLLVVSGRLWRAWRWAVPAFLGLGVIILGSWHYEYRDARLTVLPLKGGHALFLERSGGGNCLIDCGDAVNWRYRTRPFLQAQGINHLDDFVLTHGDVRHVGAATNVLAELAPRRIVLNPVGQHSLPYRRFETVAADLGFEIVRPADGEGFNGWTVVHPARGDELTRSDCSALVMRIEIEGTKLLHAPDLDAEGWRRLIERHPRLTADVLIASSVGDGSTLANGLSQLARPAQLIVVDTEIPATERLTDEAKSRLAGCGEAAAFSSQSGAIELRFRAGQRLRVDSPRMR